MNLFPYQIVSIDPLRVRSSTGKNSFLAPATRRCPKVYVVRSGHRILYVGSTTQPLRNRLYGALKADGTHGYYGPAWKSEKCPLNLDVWVLDGIECVKAKRSTVAETVEGEVVFLVRERDGNWPKHQTEIHFHLSSKRERAWAERIHASASTAAGTVPKRRKP